MALGLTTAWSHQAAAATIHLEVTPTESLSQSYVVYYLGNSSSLSPFFLGNLAAGQPSAFDHNIAGISAHDFAGPGGGFALIGVHGVGENSGVTVSFNDLPFTFNDVPNTVHDVIANGVAWDALFSPQEQQMIDSLNSPLSVNVEIFLNNFRDMLRVPYGSQGTLVNFTGAGFGGVATATIPEPATWVLLVTGAGVIALAARRRAD